MKTIFLKGLLFFLPFVTLQSLEPISEEGPQDQLTAIFSSSYYPVYKVWDFANDHGFSHAKILSYEFNGFGHKICGNCEADRNKGRFFELKDEYVTISFLCYEEAPDDLYIIDVEGYRELFELDEEADADD